VSHWSTSRTSLQRDLLGFLGPRFVRVGVLLLIGVAAASLSRGLWWDLWRNGPEHSAARGVAISYAKTLWDGDEATALGLAVEDPGNRQRVETELVTVAAVRAFSEAIAARFGPEAGRPNPYYDLGMSSRCSESARLPRLAVRIEGDSAIVCERGSEPGDEDPIYELRRVGGQWKVWEVSRDTDILTKQMQAEIAESERAFAEASQQAARDVAAGRYRTDQEAKTNLREALLRISSSSHPRPRDLKNQ
jgi:hypothetical protein